MRSWEKVAKMKFQHTFQDAKSSLNVYSIFIRGKKQKNPNRIVHRGGDETGQKVSIVAKCLDENQRQMVFLLSKGQKLKTRIR